MSEEEHLPPPVTGLVAGKYELVRLIGRGGMGSVWEGRHTSLGTRVAIKFIEAEYASSNEARARFDNEARAAATIQSKHAIQIFDHGVTSAGDGGRPYIVMEMLVGEPLDRRIERVGRMSLQETARVLGQVCRALQRAHDSGIIHRDLKPENIFLVRSPDDDDEVAKVLDFGIAKMAPPPGQQGVSSSTKTGAVLGTPYYMSPEQARGLRNVDHRTDLWSLGVIAYKCTIGVLPFEGESVGDLLVKICTSPIPTPSHVVQALPTTFDAWFARALDREPDRRFSSATELSEGLAFAAGLSVRRGPTSSNPNYPQHGAYGPPPSMQHSPSSPQHQPMLMTPGPMSAMPSTSPSPAATPPYMQGGQGSPGMTAAPFVSSTRRPGTSSRGVVVASILAALIGVSVGAFAIVKFSGGGRANGGGTSTATGSATPSATTSATATSTAVGVAVVTATASASASATPSATTTATGKAGLRPGGTGTAIATGTATATSTDKSTVTTKPTTTPTSVPTTIPTKPPTKPTSDPGY